MMFLRIKDRVINSGHIVEARIIQSGTERMRVEIVTTATDWIPLNTEVTINPYTIRLSGEEAELFLAALPVYEPVVEEVER